MIVIGYPGVGKTTVTKLSEKFIDYDSSMFPKDEGWEESYVKNVKALSDQSYVVFIGAHKKVQDLLADYKDNVVIVYPGLSLRDAWIKKLTDRYEKSNLPSDERALKRCVSFFSLDVVEMIDSPFKKVELKQSEGYDLYELLKTYIERE